MKRQLALLSILAATFFAIPLAQAASAVALADSSSGTQYGWADHSRTLADAKAEALRKCAASAQGAGLSPQGCHVVLAYGAPAYWTIYNAKDGTISAGYSPKSQQEATNRAWDSCENQCQDPADHHWYDDGTGRVPVSATSDTYTSSCSGNVCVRHYSTGKVVRFTTCVNPSTGFAFNNLDGSCSGLDMSGHMLNQ